jgi:uncharacterized protein (TIGR03083 family)
VAVLDYESALIEQNRLLGQAIFSADLGTPVPTCPGWSLLQLLRHVGRGDRWAAHIVNTRSDGDLDPRTVPDGRPPDSLEGASAWLQASPRMVIEAVASVGPNASAGTFLGPRPAAWWIRRRLHEATVHRADATLAIGERYDLSPELAVDGIEEWLDRLSTELQTADKPALSDTETIGLSATDIGVTWSIVGLPNGIRWSRSLPDSPAQVSLAGPATDVFLALVRRRAAGEADVILDGDPGTWAQWLSRTPL